MRRSYLCIINCTVLLVVRPLCQAARFTTRVQKLYTSLAPRGKRTITHNSLVTPSYCCSSILQRNSKAKKTLMNATSRIYSSCSPTAEEGNELSSNQVSGSPITSISLSITQWVQVPNCRKHHMLFVCCCLSFISHSFKCRLI